MFVGLFGETNVYDVLRCKFTAPNGTSLINYPWTDPDDYRLWSNQWYFFSANITITNNFAYVSSGGFNNLIDCGVSDCTLEIDFRCPTGGFLLPFRAINTTNHWRLFFPAAGDVARLDEMTGGTNYIRASVSRIKPTLLFKQTRVILLGNKIECYFDESYLFNYTSSVRAGLTTHGVWLTGETYADNFRVTVP